MSFVVFQTNQLVGKIEYVLNCIMHGCMINSHLLLEEEVILNAIIQITNDGIENEFIHASHHI